MTNCNSYNHTQIEAKWRQVWLENKLDEADLDSSKLPYYNLMMFPYPSAEGLHVGNMYAMTGSDIFGRYKRMQDYEVFEPIGLDGFGIHSENFAFKVGKHPLDQAEIAEVNFYRQMHLIGCMLDWSRTVETYTPEYYRWTQWLFTQMFKHGLAYRGKSDVNWCPSCRTVLADEQVIDDKCERCGNKVERKPLEQWFFRITAYAGKLQENISSLDWSDKVKTAQVNWINRKEGIDITYQIYDQGSKKVGEVTCFTTRPDTNFGATFVVLAPENPLLAEILKIVPDKKKIELTSYIDNAIKQSKQDRIAEGRKKSGVDTGLYCINHLTNAKMPLFVSDFVLPEFGTGAIVGVPGHDKRDFEFAKIFHLPVEIVVKARHDNYRSYLMGAQDISDDDLKKIGISIKETKNNQGKVIRKIEIPNNSLTGYKELIRTKLTDGFWNEIVGNDVWFCFKGKTRQIKEYTLTKQTEGEIANEILEYSDGQNIEKSSVWLMLASNSWYEPYLIQEENGTMINSDFLNGLDIKEATLKMMEYLETKGWGKRVTTYHLRDWLISRQRYWGPPIPMIYCETCAAKHQGERQDMPGWYPVPDKDLPVLLPRINDYKPTDDGIAPLAKHKEFYVTKCPGCGTKAVRETDVSDTFLDSSWYFLRYPSTRAKTKDKLAFDPEITKKWLPVNMYTGGAEHSVLHLMYARFVTMALHDWGLVHFDEPFTRFFAHGLIIKDGAKMSKSKGNVVNLEEYTNHYGADALRMYLMFMGPFDLGGDFRDESMEGLYRWVGRIWRMAQAVINHHSDRSSDKVYAELQKAIKKVGDDIEKRRYNTAIATLMEFTNLVSDEKDELSVLDLQKFLLILAPLAPYLTEELWQQINGSQSSFTISKSIHRQSWPAYDPDAFKETIADVIIQINGKVRDTISLPVNEAKAQNEVEAKAIMSEKVKKYLEGKSIRKIIFIPGKLINFVI